MLESSNRRDSAIQDARRNRKAIVKFDSCAARKRDQFRKDNNDNANYFIIFDAALC